ncbi:MAG: SNF2-related protein, partial [Acidobacteriota bacterium]
MIGVEGRRVSVLFPETGNTLQIASNSDALEELALTVGGKAKLASTGEHVVVAGIDGHTVLLDDGREMPSLDVWPLSEEPTPIDRLAQGEIDNFEDVRNRLDGLRLMRLRRADGLGSFLGGRIQIFPHQLYVAERATRALERGEPVRWLLADEVGLGKTVEAGLVMNRLLHTGRIHRALVIAPDTLIVQWLGEMWRKYNQLFVLLDRDRLRDVRREHGPNFNPFDAHRRAIISIERLSSDPKLRKWASESEVDLLVVDEAHRLRRPLTQRGNVAYRAVERISKLGRHVLFLTATPLEDDAHGFFRLLQLLRPDEFPRRDGRAGKDFQNAVEKRLAGEIELPPCTSATRRADIGGLPPRHPAPATIEDKHGWATLRGVTRALRRRRAKKGPKRDELKDLIWRSLASPQALAAAMGRRDRLRGGVGAAMNADPRVGWLKDEAPRWAREREKTLIFVAHKETLDHLKVVLGKRVAVAVFHEDLPTERRDLEVARFRLPDGPAILISTESGGEGRNFQFCTRLVLYD